MSSFHFSKNKEDKFMVNGEIIKSQYDVPSNYTNTERGNKTRVVIRRESKQLIPHKQMHIRKKFQGT